MKIESLGGAADPDAVIEALLGVQMPEPSLSEVGRVAEVADGIAVVTGLQHALCDELLRFDSGVQGIVLDLEPGRLSVVLLGPADAVSIGEEVTRTRRVVSTRVGPALLGRRGRCAGQSAGPQG